MASPIQQVEIDFAILADRAEIVNHKLYMMGGGWDRRGVIDFKVPQEISLAVGLLIPWNLTNEQHHLDIRVENDAGTNIPPEVHGTVVVGRPPHATIGQMFRAMIAVNGRWLLSGSGAYRIIAAVQGGVERTVIFYADQASVQAPPAPR